MISDKMVPDVTQTPTLGLNIWELVLSYIRKGKNRPATTTPATATVYVTLRGPPLDSELGWTG